MSKDSSDYQLLGLAEGASLVEVERAYKRLHADYYRGDFLDEADMAAIEAAYRSLQENSASVEAAASDNDDTRSGVPWGPVGALLVSLVAFLGVDIIVLAGVASVFYIIEGGSLWQAVAEIENHLIIMFLYYAVSRIGGLAVIYWFVRSRGAGWRELGFRSFLPSDGIMVVVAGLAGFFFLAALASVLIDQFAPGIDLTAEQEIPFLAAANAWEMIMAFVALVLVAPLAEEVMFRGFLLPAFRKKFRVVLAVILVSIAFGLLHPPLNAMIIIGLFSLFLCWAYIYTDSVWPAIALHAGKNLIAFLALFMVGI